MYKPFLKTLSNSYRSRSKNCSAEGGKLFKKMFKFFRRIFSPKLLLCTRWLHFRQILPKLFDSNLYWYKLMIFFWKSSYFHQGFDFILLIVENQFSRWLHESNFSWRSRSIAVHLMTAFRKINNNFSCTRILRALKSQKGYWKMQTLVLNFKIFQITSLKLCMKISTESYSFVDS